MLNRLRPQNGGGDLTVPWCRRAPAEVERRRNVADLVAHWSNQLD
jgi:hypothetical protein